MTDNEVVSDGSCSAVPPQLTTGPTERLVETRSVEQVPQFRFEDLAGNNTTIHIVFAGREYCLRRTRAGKLVLNK